MSLRDIEDPNGAIVQFLRMRDAADARRAAKPGSQHIQCMRTGCTQLAIEGPYFCCSNCLWSWVTEQQRLRGKA